MPELNVDTPLLYCQLRASYLYNGKPAPDGTAFIPCVVFGATSIPGRALGFQCLLHNGALVDRLPLAAFVHREEAPELPLDYLQLWDCFSPWMVCLEYAHLRGLRVDVVLKDRSVQEGTYQFTFDWYGSSSADNPGEGGHKCAHLIALANGCYVAQPNNRLRWYEPSFITAPFPQRPDYETNNRVWSVENKGAKWVTEPTDRQFYDIVRPDQDGA